MRMIYDKGYYRGFHIGAIVGLHGWRAAWRSSLENPWIEGSVYSNDCPADPEPTDVVRLAKECIDFQYRVEVFEFLEGREPELEDLKKIQKERTEC